MDNTDIRYIPITEAEEATLTWEERREHFKKALKQNKYSCPYNSFLILTDDTNYSFVSDICYVPDTTIVIGYWDEETDNELELHNYHGI